ncbi:MAG: hypothetical protein H6700_11125 [Myxococcales bacterium]|nr:hypothetical protein [Myxococcales bacterium]MCB9532308.1 hypothetical protein [Myxococcales bacterium]
MSDLCGVDDMSFLLQAVFSLPFIGVAVVAAALTAAHVVKRRPLAVGPRAARAFAWICVWIVAFMLDDLIRVWGAFGPACAAFGACVTAFGVAVVFFATRPWTWRRS